MMSPWRTAVLPLPAQDTVQAARGASSRGPRGMPGDSASSKHNNALQNLRPPLLTALTIGFVVLLTWCADMRETWAQESGQFVSIEELLSSCGMRHPCHAVMACEGKGVRVRGYIDYENIFQKEHYPQLPYEKFTIRGESGESLEIWVAPEHSREVFREINRHKSAPARMAYVEGEIVAFDMPIMGKCQRGIKMNLTGPDKLSFS